MRILRASAALTATALVGLAIAGAPAGAIPSAPVLRAANSVSTGFAGYAVGGAAGAAVTSASSVFTLPAVTCPASPNLGILPLTQIFDSTATTPVDAAGGVFVACVSGTLVYQVLLDINGNRPKTLAFTPVAHDNITVAVTQSATAAKVIVTDVTQNKSQTYKGKKGHVAGTDDNSNIGVGAVLINNLAVGNPAFGTLTFAPDLTNAVAIGTLPHTAFNEATATTGGTLQILTSKLNAAGNSFTTKFKHA